MTRTHRARAPAKPVAADGPGKAAPSPAELPEVLSVDEAAAWLRVNRKTVYDAVKRREFPHRRIGGVIRIHRDALLAWLRGEVRAAHGVSR